MKNITIYTTSVCPYCVRAKALLDKKGASYQEINLENNPELREKVISLSGGRRTVPQIFIGEDHIGGCDDLYELDRQGKLDNLFNNKS